MDTVFNYVEKDKGFFSSDEQRWINKIKKLAKEHPDEVSVIAMPETNDGCIYVQLPTSWLKIVPKREGPKLTEEQRAAAAERFRIAREAKRNAQASPELQ